VTVDRYARDLPPDRLDRWFFDRGFIGFGLGIALLCLVFGWKTGLLAAAFHVLFYVGLSGAVNAAGHTFGTRPHENSASNSRLLALVTFGEGLHNNHHARPTSAKFSSGRGDPDLGWWAVRAICVLRLARLRPFSA
jgi:stearoyl-CoA desaturase (delta-9 desaturase)